jgi:hypothetical protein
MVELIVTVGAIGFCWYGYKSSTMASAAHGRVRKVSMTENGFEWPPTGHYDFEIVGETYYQSAIKKLAEQNDEPVYEKEYKALLVPDDGNKNDDKAVRVDIEGMTVGHLSGEDALSFRRRLGAKKLAGQITSCKAIICGGGVRNGEKCKYGVYLNIKEFS